MKFSLLWILFAMITFVDIVSTENVIVFSEDKSVSFIVFDDPKKARLAPFLKSSDEQYRYPAYEPNGSFVFFGYLNLQDAKSHMRYSIAKANVEDHSINILIPSAYSNYERPKLSPDGRFLAFVEYSLDPTTKLSGRLKIFDLGKGIVTKTLIDAFPLVSPSWSYDSKRLLFVTSKMQMTLFDLTTDNLETFPFSVRSATWGTDGRIYFIENKDVPTTIFSMSVADRDKSVFYKRKSDRNTQMGASSSIEDLGGFSPNGKYFLMTGLTQIAGARSRTLEILDVNEKLLYTLHKGNIIGANWCFK